MKVLRSRVYLSRGGARQGWAGNRPTGFSADYKTSSTSGPRQGFRLSSGGHSTCGCQLLLPRHQTDVKTQVTAKFLSAVPTQHGDSGHHALHYSTLRPLDADYSTYHLGQKVDNSVHFISIPSISSDEKGFVNIRVTQLIIVY